MFKITINKNLNNVNDKKCSIYNKLFKLHLEDKKMKNKLRIFLFFANILFVIFLFEENVSGMSADSKITTIESLNASKMTEEKKITKNKSLNASKKIPIYRKKVLYLTFDDGPSYKITNKVIDI